MVFCSIEEPDKAKSSVEKNVQKLVTYFGKTNQLTKNAEKTDFILFSKPSKNESVEVLVNDYIIETSGVKYLRVCLDRNLTFQKEIENILRTTGSEVLHDLQNIFPEKTRLLLLNAFVISHLQYSAILLGGIRETLITTLEKQLNWRVKPCFNRTE